MNMIVHNIYAETCARYFVPQFLLQTREVMQLVLREKDVTQKQLNDYFEPIS